METTPIRVPTGILDLLDRFQDGQLARPQRPEAVAALIRLGYDAWLAGAPHLAPVAQRKERPTSNRDAAGSSPAGRAK